MTKKDKIKIQEAYKGRLTERELVVLDMQSDFAPTKPLLHRESRFLYVVSGYAKIKIQNEVVEMEEGSIIALNPWQISEIIEVQDHVSYFLLIYKYELFNYQIKNILNVNNEDFPFLQTLYKTKKVVVPERMRGKVSRLFEDIRDEVGICSMDLDLPQKPYSDVYVFSRLAELLVYFLRLAENKKNTEKENNFLSDGIFNYMFMNLTEDLSLSKLSKLFFMSESAISQYINQVTGLGFYELIQNMKLSKVEFLLLHTNLTLEEIALLLNFPDAAQLSKIFSEHTGMTANQYKKINQSYSNLIDAHFDKRSTKILEYIYDNYEDDISMLDLSNMFNMTPKNINKILKYYVEQNFTNFLATVRIKRACTLLTDTDYPIVDIALQVGFNSPKTFTRNFSSQIGMSPSEFRKLNQKQKGD